MTKEYLEEQVEYAEEKQRLAQENQEPELYHYWCGRRGSYLLLLQKFFPEEKTSVIKEC